MIRCMADRHLMYNEQKRYIREREETGEVFVLRPKEPLNIGAIEKNPGEIERVYLLGRKEAEDNLAAIKAFLK